mmetsp:Transcript_60404/g.176601  ORF Transcript_60404/g.176601 Transcript_60404/m.176601 type:complete len:234 (+) Transcript_60404:895-1596(+)
MGASALQPGLEAAFCVTTVHDIAVEALLPSSLDAGTSEAAKKSMTSRASFMMGFGTMPYSPHISLRPCNRLRFIEVGSSSSCSASSTEAAPEHRSSFASCSVLAVSPEKQNMSGSTLLETSLTKHSSVHGSAAVTRAELLQNSGASTKRSVDRRPPTSCRHCDPRLCTTESVITNSAASGEEIVAHKPIFSRSEAPAPEIRVVSTSPCSESSKRRMTLLSCLWLCATDSLRAW